MKGYGIELRRRVLEDCDGGMTERAAAEKWRVSTKWIQKIKKQRRETGSLEPVKGNLGRKMKLVAYRDMLRRMVKATPDATLEELREHLPVRVCLQTIANELSRMQLTYKKQIHAAEQDCPDVAEKRRAWKARMRDFVQDNLVFLDETSAKTNLTRLYGRALKRKRLVDKTPHNHWVTTTYVCALRRDKVIAPAVFTGAMNTPRFTEYVQQCLLPSMRSGDLVILDNLSPHKNAKAWKLFASAGVKVLYLPPYSPDFNPIEMSFSKVQSLLRKEKIRDIAKLQEFLQQSPQHFSAAECEHLMRGIPYMLSRNALDLRRFRYGENKVSRNGIYIGIGRVNIAVLHYFPQTGI